MRQNGVMNIVKKDTLAAAMGFLRCFSFRFVHFLLLTKIPGNRGFLTLIRQSGTMGRRR